MSGLEESQGQLRVGDENAGERLAPEADRARLRAADEENERLRLDVQTLRDARVLREGLATSRQLDLDTVQADIDRTNQALAEEAAPRPGCPAGPPAPGPTARWTEGKSAVIGSVILRHEGLKFVLPFQCAAVVLVHPLEVKQHAPRLSHCKANVCATSPRDRLWLRYEPGLPRRARVPRPPRRHALLPQAACAAWQQTPPGFCTL